MPTVSLLSLLRYMSRLRGALGGFGCITSRTDEVSVQSRVSPMFIKSNPATRTVVPSRDTLCLQQTSRPGWTRAQDQFPCCVVDDPRFLSSRSSAEHTGTGPNRQPPRDAVDALASNVRSAADAITRLLAPSHQLLHSSPPNRVHAAVAPIFCLATE